MLKEELFCEHGVFMGDANTNRPCPKCVVADLAEFEDAKWKIALLLPGGVQAAEAALHAEMLACQEASRQFDPWTVYAAVARAPMTLSQTTETEEER